ncbi:hypothetical protein H6790_00320 [Candidatus Nomurabacteria bacterium]|nr:hypothetical protein [Candidatus Nomurabacteria bacterium]MCB9820380.1 hypothetical protein [Candidatus Nomurabacteria bacterium]
MTAESKKKRDAQSFSTILGLAWFLAFREIKRANKWTTALIVFVMMLTFLNLTVVTGILVGLIEGSVEANREYYTGDVMITPKNEFEYIKNSPYVESVVKNAKGYIALTSRYASGGTVETNYRDSLERGEKINSAGALLVGIDPDQEDAVTGISQKMIEGEYLTKNDAGYIMIGSDLLFKYTPIESPSYTTLKNVEVGSRVRLKIGEATKEVIVKGIIKSKAGDVDARVYMNDTELRNIIGRTDFNVDEIVVDIDENIVSAEEFKQGLVDSGLSEYGKVQTFEDAQPKFLKDIKATFAILGNVIGSIGLVVACITIFIVIFVNAITRRRYIGILKGIGVSEKSIEISYVFQSLFYAVLGILVASFVLFFVLKPFIAQNPINFPFSDGILVATVPSTMIRATILMIATIFAGFIPARIVVKQNTLSAILGR